MGTLANSEDYDEMQDHPPALITKTKSIYRERNAMFSLNYNLWPLDIYNALSIYG